MTITNIKQKLSIAITVAFIACFGFFVYAEQAFDKNVFNDSDQDGLSDQEEKTYGTNPSNRDTDGDSYSDGAEVKSGYDPLRPAPGDKLAIQGESGDIKNVNGDAFQNKLDTEFSNFILSKQEEEDISLEELEGFVSENIEDELIRLEQNSSLTEEEINAILIKKQEYSSLSEEDRKVREQADGDLYLAQMYEFFIRNAPMKLETSEERKAAYEEYVDEFSKLSAGTSDYVYFRKLGEKFETAYPQVMLIEVPEKLFDLHVSFLTIGKSLLGLRKLSLPMEDSTGRLMIMSRVVAILDSLDEFSTDFADLFDEK